MHDCHLAYNIYIICARTRCSHETVTGYVLLLSSTLPELEPSAWNAIDELPIHLSLRDQRLLYELRLVPNWWVSLQSVMRASEM